MNLVKFPENLKRAMLENGWTQKALAEELNTTQATVSRWLKGIYQPDFQTLLEICICLNESPNALLGYDEIPSGFFHKEVK